jgi:hypothetical protein
LLALAALPGGGYDFRAIFGVPLALSCVAAAIAYLGVRETPLLTVESSAEAG